MNKAGKYSPAIWIILNLPGIDNAKHTLALADAYNSHDWLSGHETLPDYPGEYRTKGHRETTARTRMEALHNQYEHIRAESDVRAAQAGGLFKLSDILANTRAASTCRKLTLKIEFYPIDIYWFSR